MAVRMTIVREGAIDELLADKANLCGAGVCASPPASARAL
jgi:hypothetical protein